MPPPPRRPSKPPPPGRAEKLVAQAGFVVYEGGTSVFDESVLVYLARPSGQWPDFDICNHVGRPLAYARSRRRNSLFQMRAPIIYFDPAMNQILRVEPNFPALKRLFDVSGVANARVSSRVGRAGQQLIIEANNESFGSIVGSRFAWMTGRSLKILDEESNQVGMIRSFKDGGLFSRVDHYVMSIEPGLGGDLRRLLVGVPSMIATITRQQQSS